MKKDSPTVPQDYEHIIDNIKKLELKTDILHKNIHLIQDDLIYIYKMFRNFSFIVGILGIVICVLAYFK